MSRPPTQPRPGSQATDGTRRTVTRLVSAMSLVSALGAAAIGTVAALFLGPYLAMGAAMYTGNTEPQQPAAPYPWGLFLLGCAVAVGSVVLARREPAREAFAHALLHAAAIFLALLPFWQLYRLYRLT